MVIITGLHNSYGDLIVREEDGKYYMTLQNDNGARYHMEISEYLYNAFKEEFKDGPKNQC